MTPSRACVRAGYHAPAAVCWLCGDARPWWAAARERARDSGRMRELIAEMASEIARVESRFEARRRVGA